MTDIVPSDAQTAELVVQSDAPQFRLSVRVTPSGLLAIAGLVSSILLSTSALVWVAGAVHRKAHLPWQ